jgi:hypothetical protein
LPLFFRSKPPITSQISSQDTPQATPQQTSEDIEENWEIFRRESSSPPPEYDTSKEPLPTVAVNVTSSQVPPPQSSEQKKQGSKSLTSTVTVERKQQAASMSSTKSAGTENHLRPGLLPTPARWGELRESTYYRPSAREDTSNTRLPLASKASSRAPRVKAR